MSRTPFFKLAGQVSLSILLLLAMREEGRAGIIRFVVTEVEGEFQINRGGLIFPGVSGMEILEGDEVSSAGNSMLKIEHSDDGVLLNNLTLAGFLLGSTCPGSLLQRNRTRGGYNITLDRATAIELGLKMSDGVLRKAKIRKDGPIIVVETETGGDVIGVRGFDGIVSFEPLTQRLDFSVLSGVGQMFDNVSAVDVHEGHWISAIAGVIQSPEQPGIAPHLGPLGTPCPEPGTLGASLVGLFLAASWRLKKRFRSIVELCPQRIRHNV